MAVTALVFVLSLAVRGGVALLIIGLMIGYVASAFPLLMPKTDGSASGLRKMF